MFQLLLFVFSLVLSFSLFNYHTPTLPSNVANTGVAELPYVIANTPITILVVAIILDAVINVCLYVLLSAWRELPRNKLAYEKELDRQRKKDEDKRAVKEKFKQLKERAEQGKSLTVDEEKWLEKYMGPLWYATLKRNKAEEDTKTYYECNRCSHKSDTEAEAKAHIQIHKAAIKDGINVGYKIKKTGLKNE